MVAFFVYFCYNNIVGKECEREYQTKGKRYERVLEKEYLYESTTPDYGWRFYRAKNAFFRG